MYKPIIGITTASTWVNTSGPLSSRSVTTATNANIQPVIDLGGIPVLIPVMHSIENINALAAFLDGILLPGGQDIEPSNYGQEQKVVYSSDVQSLGQPYLRPRAMAPDINRDKFEIALYNAAKKLNKPIFGICRGMQLINAAEGGTLHQEVSEVATIMHEIDHSGYSHHHEIIISEASLFHEVFNTKSYFGPSMHHQAVDTMGTNLIASGRATDSVIEFLEYKDSTNFVIGVQGDIERARRNLTGFERLYERFINECRLRSPRAKVGVI